MSWNGAQTKISALFLFWNDLMFSSSWKSETVPRISGPILKLKLRKKEREWEKKKEKKMIQKVLKLLDKTKDEF